MKLILKLICLKLAVKLCSGKFSEKLYHIDSATDLADSFYDWLMGKRQEE